MSDFIFRSIFWIFFRCHMDMDHSELYLRYLAYYFSPELSVTRQTQSQEFEPEISSLFRLIMVGLLICIESIWLSQSKDGIRLFVIITRLSQVDAVHRFFDPIFHGTGTEDSWPSVFTRLSHRIGFGGDRDRLFGNLSCQCPLLRAEVDCRVDVETEEV